MDKIICVGSICRTDLTNAEHVQYVEHEGGEDNDDANDQLAGHGDDGDARDMQ